MSQVIDINKEFIKAKAKETIIGYAGFVFKLPPDSQTIEGNLVISSLKRPDGSGYLSVTFMLDAEHDTAAPTTISRMFAHFKRGNPFADLGRQFQMMIDTDIDLEKSSNWFMNSFTFYVDHLGNIKRHHVESQLIPAFQAGLPITFQPVEWLSEETPVGISPGPSGRQTKETPGSFLNRLRNRLES